MNIFKASIIKVIHKYSYYYVCISMWSGARFEYAMDRIEITRFNSELLKHLFKLEDFISNKHF